MGYCVSEEDMPGLEPGQVDMELRRESVIFHAEGSDSDLEIPYSDLPRLHQLIEFALRHERRK